MTLRGERFHVDFEPDEDEGLAHTTSHHSEASASASPIVADIRENPISKDAPAPATSPRPNPNGFPLHKKRASRFKQRLNGHPDPSAPKAENTAQHGSVMMTDMDRDKATIDRENTERLSAMSSDEIERERQELMEALDPLTIERLLRRNEKSERRHPLHDGGPKTPRPEEAITERDSSDLAPLDSGANHSQISANLQEGKAVHSISHAAQMHFPKSEAAPSIDPSAPSFLSDLHSRYFPSLPQEPSKLAWMSSSNPEESPFASGRLEVPVSAMRFSFEGVLLSRHSINSIPVTKGLHHHGQAPESAGYTIPELAYLARSSFPAQRCIAYQTLGRILYRLGIGQYGPADGNLASGLWNCVDDGRVIQSLEEEAAKAVGHMSSKTLALEALWLWQKGGGHRWKAA